MSGLIMEGCCRLLRHLIFQKKRCPQEYIPVYRSGPYAILVALYNAEQVNARGQRHTMCGLFTHAVTFTFVEAELLWLPQQV